MRPKSSGAQSPDGKFWLVLNLKTAKQLGIKAPFTLSSSRFDP